MALTQPSGQASACAGVVVVRVNETCIGLAERAHRYGAASHVSGQGQIHTVCGTSHSRKMESTELVGVVDPDRAASRPPTSPLATRPTDWSNMASSFLHAERLSGLGMVFVVAL